MNRLKHVLGRLRAALSERFGPTVYVQVRPNVFSALHLESGRKAEAQASFSHERMLIGQFYEALSALDAVLASLPLPRLGRPLLNLVLHPLETSSGGLSGVEIRVFHELGHSTGAGRVFLWSGAELSRLELQHRVYRTNPLVPAVGQW